VSIAFSRDDQHIRISQSPHVLPLSPMMVPTMCLDIVANKGSQHVSRQCLLDNVANVDTHHYLTTFLLGFAITECIASRHHYPMASTPPGRATIRLRGVLNSRFPNQFNSAHLDQGDHSIHFIWLKNWGQFNSIQFNNVQTNSFEFTICSLRVPKLSARSLMGYIGKSASPPLATHPRAWMCRERR